jgi:hypothetical protein
MYPAELPASWRMTSHLQYIMAIDKALDQYKTRGISAGSIYTSRNTSQSKFPKNTFHPQLYKIQHVRPRIQYE